MKLSNEHPAHPEWVDPFDRSYVKSMAQAILSPLAHRYFHAEMHGFDTLPSRPNPEKPLLFASNHYVICAPPPCGGAQREWECKSCVELDVDLEGVFTTGCFADERPSFVDRLRTRSLRSGRGKGCQGTQMGPLIVTGGPF